MKKMILALVLVGLPSVSFAEPKAMPQEVVGLSAIDSRLNIASVQKQVILVQSQKNNSDLRVSLVVLDNGGSTDVSPKATLYLTTFNESEMKDADSVHSIVPINELISAERVEAGVYEATVKMYDFDSVCTGWQGEIEGLMKIRIDARQLTADVRSFKGVDEFETKTLQTPIFVEYTCM